MRAGISSVLCIVVSLVPSTATSILWILKKYLSDEGKNRLQGVSTQWNFPLSLAGSVSEVICADLTCPSANMM